VDLEHHVAAIGKAQAEGRADAELEEMAGGGLGAESRAAEGRHACGDPAGVERAQDRLRQDPALGVRELGAERLDEVPGHA